MLLPTRSGKNRNEKRWFRYNVFNNSELQISLMFCVFATNCTVGGLHEKYERHFVKKNGAKFGDLVIRMIENSKSLSALGTYAMNAK